MATKRTTGKLKTISKSPTGIAGLDQITDGGFPTGRAALVCGGPGSGKTLLAVEFVLRGILLYDEPGVIMTFEENASELSANLASMGYDLPRLVRDKKLVIDHVAIDRRQIHETGEYELEGIFIRLDHAIKSVGAKRVVLDTLEVLFAGLEDMGLVRAEMGRLFRWLKDRGITAVVTAESGEANFTRHGLEEYVADCVIMLDHRVTEQVSTRRIRVVKYRGSTHHSNEYPFLLQGNGISVFPITSLGLTHDAPTERVSSGVHGLDEMLGGKGFYKGSSVLLSGTAGTGKSSFAAAFVEAACVRGERAVYFAFEESPKQILRNMHSVGIHLESHVVSGALRIQSSRSTSAGLENHLATMQHLVTECRPSVVVVDPITNLISGGDPVAVKSMLTRLVDFLKGHGITAVLTNLMVEGIVEEATGISSLMDTWLMVRDVDVDLERRRLMSVLKSRGMAHSHRSRYFTLGDDGIQFDSPAGAQLIAPRRKAR